MNFITEDPGIELIGLDNKILGKFAIKESCYGFILIIQNNTILNWDMSKNRPIYNFIRDLTEGIKWTIL